MFEETDRGIDDEGSYHGVEDGGYGVEAFGSGANIGKPILLRRTFWTMKVATVLERSGVWREEWHG